MIVLTDTGFHAKTGDPVNMKVCPRGTWNTRMLVETVLSMLTTVFHSKNMGHRVWAYFRARVAWTMAINLLARWGMEIDEHDMICLSIAEFSFNKLTPWVSKRPKVSGRKLAARVEPHESSKIQCVIHSAGQIPLPF